MKTILQSTVRFKMNNIVGFNVIKLFLSCLENALLITRYTSMFLHETIIVMNALQLQRSYKTFSYIENMLNLNGNHEII